MRRNRALSAEEKMDAREALEILSGSRFGLKDAALLAVGSSQKVQPTRISDAVDLLVRDAVKRKLRPSTINYYETTLNMLVDAWPEDALLDSVTRSELREWLTEMASNHQTQMSTFRAVRRLYNFALEHEPPLVLNSPCTSLRLQPVKQEKSISCLTVDETKSILLAAKSTPYAPTIALMLFAGIRPLEVSGKGKRALQWEDIDLDDKIIRIPAETAKTRRTRVLEGLPENLWKWLDGGEGPICPSLVRQAQRVAADSIARSWPQDGCRHSFATYHVAKYNDISRTSLLMGHEGNPTMIHRHYRGIASKADATKYFNLTPDSL